MYDKTSQFGIFIKVNGVRVTEYSHSLVTFIEGRPGSKYELELVNNSYERILMIPSVDGLSVMDGKEAGLTSEGYVLNAHQSYSIPGWRRTDNTVAEFVFADAKQSYTVRTGTGANNMGAIGALVFREKIHQPVYRSSFAPYHSLIGSGSLSLGGGGGFGDAGGGGNLRGIDMACSANSAKGMISTQNINNVTTQTFANDVGTGYGNEASFKTISVNFEKRDAIVPDELLAIYYDSAKGLEKRGIVLEYRTRPQPNPFPKYVSSSTTPPPGWNPRGN